MRVKGMMKKGAAGLLAAMMLCVPVMAGGECGYGTDDIEDECELWWNNNSTEHWCECWAHEDENGNSPITYGPEPHTFEDGRCTMCGETQAAEVLTEADADAAENNNQKDGESSGLSDEEALENGLDAAGMGRSVSSIAGFVSELIRLIRELAAMQG